MAALNALRQDFDSLRLVVLGYTLASHRIDWLFIKLRLHNDIII